MWKGGASRMRGRGYSSCSGDLWKHFSLPLLLYAIQTGGWGSGGRGRADYAGGGGTLTDWELCEKRLYCTLLLILSASVKRLNQLACSSTHYTPGGSVYRTVSMRTVSWRSFMVMFPAKHLSFKTKEKQEKCNALFQKINL